MSQLNATDLAKHLNVSLPRVSQYVSEGKLDGCWQGAGRQRRFDLERCVLALGRKLDPGQMLGNGAETRKALGKIRAGAVPKAEPAPVPRRDGALSENDPDRYELARTAKAEEELRRLRRDNDLSEGSLILASEAERQIARVLGQEIAEIETVLREAARKVADTLGVDFRAVRQVLTETWREHRKGRTAVLAAATEAAEMTGAEKAADI